MDGRFVAQLLVRRIRALLRFDIKQVRVYLARHACLAKMRMGFLRGCADSA
jgi:hypothetical protein